MVKHFILYTNSAFIVMLLPILFVACDEPAAKNDKQTTRAATNNSTEDSSVDILRPGEELQPVHSYTVSFEEITSEKDGREVDENPFRFFSDCFGDVGRMGPSESKIEWKEPGIVTTSRSLGWAGMWHSLEGLARQSDRTLDLRKCYPSFIRDPFQPKCVGLMIRTNGTGLLKLELKAPDETLLWMQRVHVDSVPFRSQRFDLPTDKLRSVKLLNWIVELGTVSIDEIALIIQYPELPVETRTFLKSYAKLARCYDEPTGIVRDRANWPVGDFDSVPGSGLFCLATCAAADLGIVEPEFAKDTLKKVYRTIDAIPTNRGVLPHFVRRYDGQYRIHHGTEFSTVDHSLYAFSMMLSATMLNDTDVLAGIVNGVRKIEFDRLRDVQGRISHGVADDGTVLEHSWFDWGSETALVLMLERVALGKSANLKMSDSGKPHDEIGFIPLLCDLLTDRFDSERPDAVTHQNWNRIKRELLAKQRSYFVEHLPMSRAATLGIYGLSAGEGSRGVGYVANGTALDKVRLIHPHYILLSAPLLSHTN
ncbi:MAG: hypothetical protein KDA89_18765, partial [Planctomycetaceae bacterium]|nr:hypothetical protein [Planctomycetaceae bacterium]